MNNKNKSEREEKPDPKYQQFEEFGGIIDLDISIRIPSSFYEAVKEYSKIAEISPREYFNHAIIDMISSLEIGILNEEFTKKYHLRKLSAEKREAMIHAHKTYKLSEEKLGDI